MIGINYVAYFPSSPIVELSSAPTGYLAIKKHYYIKTGNMSAVVTDIPSGKIKKDITRVSPYMIQAERSPNFKTIT